MFKCTKNFKSSYNSWGEGRGEIKYKGAYLKYKNFSLIFDEDTVSLYWNFNKYEIRKKFLN